MSRPDPDALRPRLPSPLQEVDDEPFARRGLRLLLKRDDLIHPDLPRSRPTGCLRAWPGHSIEAQLEPMSADLAEIASSLDPEILRDPDVLHKAWIAADLDRARMLLRVVLHSVTLLPPPGQGRRSGSIGELYARCCFHWVGAKQEPLKADNRRLHNTVWFDPEPAAWQSAA